MEIELETKCHDCDKQIEMNGKGEVIGAKCLKYKKPDGEDIFIFKCDKCYDKFKGLTNFQKCEVYSRVVGYYRPINQWNYGKQEEFKDRKNFKDI